VVDLPGVNSGDGRFYNLRVLPPPPPAISSVINSASLTPDLAPGSSISIFGTALASPALKAKPNVNAVYPERFGNSSVTMNGVAALLTFVDRGQINAIVPYEFAGQRSVRVVVEHHDVETAAFELPLRDTAPAIFRASQTGSGQGSILQTDAATGQVSFNCTENPASEGRRDHTLCHRFRIMERSSEHRADSPRAICETADREYVAERRGYCNDRRRSGASPVRGSGHGGSAASERCCAR
jgi:hypothetical protein